jgi:hypothetical protein
MRLFDELVSDARGALADFVRPGESGLPGHRL